MPNRKPLPLLDWRDILNAARQHRKAIDDVIVQLEYLAGVGAPVPATPHDAATRVKAARKVALATAMLNGHTPPPGRAGRPQGSGRVPAWLFADLAAHPDSRRLDIVARGAAAGFPQKSILNAIDRQFHTGAIIATGERMQRRFSVAPDRVPTPAADIDPTSGLAGPLRTHADSGRQHRGEGPRAVLAFIAAHPRCQLPAIRDGVAAALPWLKPTAIGDVLQRLQKAKLIRAGGPAGSLRFAVTPAGAQKAADGDGPAVIHDGDDAITTH